MIDRQWLDERGWRRDLVAPVTAPGDRDARLEHLRQALEAFRSVLRPLVAEATYGWRELETGLPSQEFPSTTRHLWAVAGALPRIALRPFYAEAPAPEVVTDIDGDLVARALPGVPEPEPTLQSDWLELRTRAVAVRTLTGFDSITMERIGQAIPCYQPSWFAGPIGDRDFEMIPPAQLVLTSEGLVSLSLSVHWSGWFVGGRPESAAFEQGVVRLLERGWAAAESRG